MRKLTDVAEMRRIAGIFSEADTKEEFACRTLSMPVGEKGRSLSQAFCSACCTTEAPQVFDPTDGIEQAEEDEAARWADVIAFCGDGSLGLDHYVINTLNRWLSMGDDNPCKGKLVSFVVDGHMAISPAQIGVFAMLSGAIFGGGSSIIAVGLTKEQASAAGISARELSKKLRSSAVDDSTA